jgi:hypothetical protein
MSTTTIYELTDKSWTNVVDLNDLFMISVVSGPRLYLAVTPNDSTPSITSGHVMDHRVIEHLNRADTGSGYIWIRAQAGGPWTTRVAVTTTTVASTYEIFQVSDGVGGHEDFQVDDGASGYEDYEVTV